MTNLNILWKTQSHKVLSSILTDTGAVVPAMSVLGHRTDLFPPQDAKIYEAVVKCYNDGTPPTPEAVVARMNGNADLGYIKSIANQFNIEDNKFLLYNADELKKFGMLHITRRIGKELSTITDPDKLQEYISSTEAELSGVMALRSERSGEAKDVSTDAWTFIENFDASLEVKTGIPWFDAKAGGLWPEMGMNYWVAGRMKGGKTSLLRNLTLSLLNQGVPVDVFSAEESREMYTLACQAMLATQIMIERYGIPYNDNQRLHLSSLYVVRAWQRDGRLFDYELKSIKEARAIWESYPVRIYDSRDGITNHATFSFMAKRSKVDHGMRVLLCDYSQLFGDSGTDFERQSSTARLVQKIAAEEKVAVVMLTQQNTEKIKDPSGYLAGVKFGGDAEQAADFLFIPTIDPLEKEYLSLELKHSRWTSTGKGEHLINPTTGLIVANIDLSDGQNPKMVKCRWGFGDDSAPF